MSENVLACARPQLPLSLCNRWWSSAHYSDKLLMITLLVTRLCVAITKHPSNLTCSRSFVWVISHEGGIVVLVRDYKICMDRKCGYSFTEILEQLAERECDKKTSNNKSCCKWHTHNDLFFSKFYTYTCTVCKWFSLLDCSNQWIERILNQIIQTSSLYTSVIWIWGPVLLGQTISSNKMVIRYWTLIIFTWTKNVMRGIWID